jgi:hypothetical protein
LIVSVTLIPTDGTEIHIYPYVEKPKAL